MNSMTNPAGRSRSRRGFRPSGATWGLGATDDVDTIHVHPHHPHQGGPWADGGGPGGRRRGGGRGRAQRGDVRAAVLTLLAEEPMHGYQLMQAIADRSGGRWAPSPGAIYPTINQLEDEGLVTVTADAGRRLVTLTEEGRQQAEATGEHAAAGPFDGFADAGPGSDLRALIDQVQSAVRQVARTGSDEQRTAAAAVLAEARRALYLLLADGPTSR